jgi:amino acid permease
MDLVISLAVQVQGVHPSSYENLGFVTYGSIGRLVVIISKGLYSFGCLVAYVVIVKDNFSFALVHLIYGDNGDDDEKTSLLKSALSNQNFVTIFLCSTVMLPLSLLREVKPLERFSALKITVVLMIVAIVIYLFAVLENGQQAPEGRFVDHWIFVYDGVFERYVHGYCVWVAIVRANEAQLHEHVIQWIVSAEVWGLFCFHSLHSI